MLSMDLRPSPLYDGVMSAEDVTQALQNLTAIKDGHDPRSMEDDSPSAKAVNTEDVARSAAEKMVADMKYEVMCALEEYPDLKEHISLEQLTFYVAGWKKRRGLCTYNARATRDEFGEKVDKSTFDRHNGSHAIGMAKRIYEDDNNWEGTVRHELAHAALYEKYGEGQEHNTEFKRLNRRIDGSEGAKHQRDDYNYAISCPNGCFTTGKMRRSKKVQRPWERRCKHCGSTCVSHDYGDKVPNEQGTCAVESIIWNDQRGYWRHDGGL